MTNSKSCSDCCRHAAELRRDLTNALDIAEQLVGLLLAQSGPVPARAQLHVVGQPLAPQKPHRLADVIAFPAPSASSGGQPASSRVSGI